MENKKINTNELLMDLKEEITVILHQSHLDEGSRNELVKLAIDEKLVFLAGCRNSNSCDV